MIVCICHNVNEKKIIEAVKTYPIQNIKQLQEHMVICQQCRKCSAEIKKIIHHTRNIGQKNDTMDK